jgi:hypothetical protein
MKPAHVARADAAGMIERCGLAARPRVLAVSQAEHNV